MITKTISVLSLRPDDIVLSLGSDKIVMNVYTDSIVTVEFKDGYQHRYAKNDFVEVIVTENEKAADNLIYKTALAGINGEIICETSNVGVTVSVIGFLTEQEYRVFLGHEMQRLDI